MKNTIRVLAAAGLKPLLECNGKKYAAEIEYFLDSDGHLSS